MAVNSFHTITLRLNRESMIIFGAASPFSRVANQRLVFGVSSKISCSE